MAHWLILLAVFGHCTLRMRCGKELSALHLEKADQGADLRSHLGQRPPSDSVPANPANQPIPLQPDADALNHALSAFGPHSNQVQQEANIVLPSTDNFLEDSTAQLHASQEDSRAMTALEADPAADQVQAANNHHFVIEQDGTRQSLTERVRTLGRELSRFGVDFGRTLWRNPPPQTLLGAAFAYIMCHPETSGRTLTNLGKQSARSRNGMGTNINSLQLTISDVCSQDSPVVVVLLHILFLVWLYYFIKDFNRYRRH
ncbi:hypothetical protein PGTUg99_003601 [Puccinia graminis f. sp. tritici]|uniref:Uncharacterized protein n=1 Tax=Puccinia graminis f. sp. tritici TaxID=56615 RepID=A0A5B0QL47_PUCGR|nr:hypothetical protein PGTUg99_003601 [Puccinia graminis f. sp. tritici]